MSTCLFLLITILKHLIQSHKILWGTVSSHPKFLRHSSCSMILAGSTTGAKNPSGSYTELDTNNIPCLVQDISWTFILNLNESVSAHHSNPRALSRGKLSLSRSSSFHSLARRFSGMVCRRVRLLLLQTSSLTKNGKVFN